MKQVLKLYGKFIFSRPLGPVLVLIICSVATAQLVVLSCAADVLASRNILPESLRTIMVFIKSGTSQEDVQKLKIGINGLAGVDKTIFIPGEEGLRKMKEWLGEDSPVVSGLEGDMLPDAIEVVIKDANLSSIGKIAGDIEKIPGVDKTRCNAMLAGETVSILRDISEVLRYASGLYAACLGLLIFCLIKMRLTKKGPVFLFKEGLLSINLAVVLEGATYILISAAVGRYLADIAAGQAILMAPELRNIMEIHNIRPVLMGIGFSVLSGTAGVVFSLKVRE